MQRPVMVRKKCAQDWPDESGLTQAASTSLFKPANGSGVETNPHNKKKRSTVHLPNWYCACLAELQGLNQLVWRARKLHLLCKDVSRSHRNDAEWR